MSRLSRARSTDGDGPTQKPRAVRDVPALGSNELRRIDVRVHGVLSTTMGMLAVALSPLTPHLAVVVAVGAVAIMAGVVHLLVDPDRFTSRSLTVGHVAAVVSVMVGSGATGHSADLAAGPILCVIVTIHAACFRRRKETWLLVGWCLVCYAAVLVVTVGGLRAFGATCVLTGALLPIALTLTWLRQHIDTLVLELHRLADHDSLTGLLNREGLRRRAQDSGSPSSTAGLLALFLLDVDRFKALNDDLGHVAGDAALAWLGGHLRSCVRDPALVARYGGEEFVVLLPIDSLQAARDRADDLRRSVATAASAGPGQLTVSIGVAAGGVGEDFLELYKRADLALYAAKAAGRNRVEVSGWEADTEVERVAGTGVGQSSGRWIDTPVG